MIFFSLSRDKGDAGGAVRSGCGIANLLAINEEGYRPSFEPAPESQSPAEGECSFYSRLLSDWDEDVIADNLRHRLTEKPKKKRLSLLLRSVRDAERWLPGTRGSLNDIRPEERVIQERIAARAALPRRPHFIAAEPQARKRRSVAAFLPRTKAWPARFD